MFLLRFYCAIICLSACLIVPSIGQAELASLLQGSAFQSARSSLLQARADAPLAKLSSGSGSLFAGKGGLGLFAPHPKRTPETLQQASLGVSVPQGHISPRSAQILNLISKAEAGSKGYDAVQHGARIPPSNYPTQMTLNEIYRWIDQTPGQAHAIGRYQFIPATLRRLVKDAGLSRNETFSPRIQDILATALLHEAGLADINSGQIGRRTFMNNLARIWAGLPNSSGRSHYHGIAGNKATMTWARFETEMRRIFPS